MLVDDLERAYCPLCSSAEHEPAYPQFSPYCVVQCRACAFYFLSPRLKEDEMLSKYKLDSYFEGEGSGYASYEQQAQTLMATFRRLMVNLSARQLTGGALLEVGCGFGYLLEAAKGYFDMRVGTDFSSLAVEQASQRADRVYCGGPEQIPSEQKFDCIIATHVIEHVYQPLKFLRDLCRHLRPSGKLVVAAPNMGSWWRWLMGHHWPLFKIPEHVLYFDRKSLKALVRQAGFVDVELLAYPHAFPLSLVASKFGLAMPEGLGRLPVWLPASTVAVYGTFTGD
jgi:SAM-dependent methyltransferase